MVVHTIGQRALYADPLSLGSQPDGHGNSLRSRLETLLAEGMYIAMFSDADNMLSNKND